MASITVFFDSLGRVCAGRTEWRLQHPSCRAGFRHLGSLLGFPGRQPWACFLASAPLCRRPYFPRGHWRHFLLRRLPTQYFAPRPAARASRSKSSAPVGRVCVGDGLVQRKGAVVRGVAIAVVFPDGGVGLPCDVPHKYFQRNRQVEPAVIDGRVHMLEAVVDPPRLQTGCGPCSSASPNRTPQRWVRQSLRSCETAALASGPLALDHRFPRDALKISWRPATSRLDIGWTEMGAITVNLPARAPLAPYILIALAPRSATKTRPVESSCMSVP